MSDKKSGITALIIMDGFGVPVDKERSAILEENTKNIQELAKKYPSTKIYASEPAYTYIRNIEKAGNWSLVSSSNTQEENGYKFKFCVFENKNIKQM